MSLPAEFISGIDLSGYRAVLAKERSMNSRLIRHNSDRVMGAFHPSCLMAMVGESDGAESSLTVAKIQKTFQNCSASDINDIVCQMLQYASSNSSLIQKIAHNDELVSTIKDRVGIFETSSSLSSYLSLILLLTQGPDDEIIDVSFVYAVQEFLSKYPDLVLEFYSKIPTVSAYGRNAMVCAGVISDIVAFCQNPENEALLSQAANVILSIYDCKFEAADPSLTRDYMPEIVSLLQMDSSEAVSIIIKTLSLIARMSPNFVSMLFGSNIQVFLASGLKREELADSCLLLTESLAICDCDGIQKLLCAGVIGIIREMISSELQGGAFRVLSNCLESAPDTMIAQIDGDFIQCVSSAMDDCPFSVMKDAVFFVSTLIKCAPDSDVILILKYNFLTQIVEMLESDLQPIVQRCLEAIEKVLHVSFVSSGGTYGMPEDDLESQLDKLSGSGSYLISSTAKRILTDLRQLKRADRQ